MVGHPWNPPDLMKVASQHPDGHPADVLTLIKYCRSTLISQDIVIKTPNFPGQRSHRNPRAKDMPKSADKIILLSSHIDGPSSLGGGGDTQPLFILDHLGGFNVDDSSTTRTAPPSSAAVVEVADTIDCTIRLPMYANKDFFIMMRPVQDGAMRLSIAYVWLKSAALCDKMHSALDAYFESGYISTLEYPATSSSFL